MSGKSRSLWNYILIRLLQAIPVFFSVIFLSFMLIHLAPGNPVDILAGDYAASPEFRERIMREFGLDKPLMEQLMIYVAKVLTGDLGISMFFRRPVVEVILQSAPATIVLVGASILWGACLGVILGVIASKQPFSIVDSLISGLSVFFFSTPVFWLGQIVLVVFAINLDLLPAQGMYSPKETLHGLASAIDLARHLVLPSFALGCNYLALVTRLTRASMLEVLNQDYIVTARAKGLRRKTIFYKHALRNALLPVVTVTGLSIAFVFAGAVLTETVFGWPGLGRLMFNSIGARDYPLLMGLFIFISIAVVVTNLATDIIYCYVDPRIKYR